MSTRLDPDSQGKTGTASVPIGPTPKQATTQTRAGSEILAAVEALTPPSRLAARRSDAPGDSRRIWWTSSQQPAAFGCWCPAATAAPKSACRHTCG